MTTYRHHSRRYESDRPSPPKSLQASDAILDLYELPNNTEDWEVD